MRSLSTLSLNIFATSPPTSPPPLPLSFKEEIHQRRKEVSSYPPLIFERDSSLYRPIVATPYLEVSYPGSAISRRSSAGSSYRLVTPQYERSDWVRMEDGEISDLGMDEATNEDDMTPPPPVPPRSQLRSSKVRIDTSPSKTPSPPQTPSAPRSRKSSRSSPSISPRKSSLYSPPLDNYRDLPSSYTISSTAFKAEPINHALTVDAPLPQPSSSEIMPVFSSSNEKRKSISSKDPARVRDGLEAKSSTSGVYTPTSFPGAQGKLPVTPESPSRSSSLSSDTSDNLITPMSNSRSSMSSRLSSIGRRLSAQIPQFSPNSPVQTKDYFTPQIQNTNSFDKMALPSARLSDGNWKTQMDLGDQRRIAVERAPPTTRRKPVPRMDDESPDV